jgi:hypothetical protein
METQTIQTRQTIGCGFLPPPPKGISVEPWRPNVSAGYAHQPDLEVTTCVGYLRQLPEVIEGARARGHWKNGQLEAFAGGMPSEHLVRAVELYDVAANEVQFWAMTPSKDGGGAG